MRLSKKSEYACLALIDLSESYEKGAAKIEAISKRKRIPKKFLEQILIALKRAGYLHSKRGNDGGYWLAKDPGEIKVAEVLRLMDGPLAPVDSVSQYFYRPTPIERHPRLHCLFKDVRQQMIEKIEKTSFADLIR
ncbi:MAG: Rrf2 family transcriptional regulator [Acidobacteria bacterium]|nr:Rrf2 family transcriptional regulator [Acidobacteriota bacterium]